MGDWTGCLQSVCLRKRKAGSKTLGSVVCLFICVNKKFVVVNRTSGFCTSSATPSAKLLSGPSVSLHMYDCSNKAKHELRCAGCLNFSLPYRRFFCFPLDSAALSDSWRAPILIIALHQCVYFFFLLFCVFVSLVFWCNPLLVWSFFCSIQGSASARNHLKLSVFGCSRTLPWFACLSNNAAPRLFAESIAGFRWNSPAHPASRCLMERGSVRRAARAHPGRWLMAPRWSWGQDSG